MASQINRRDLPWVVLIVILFVFGLAVSWQRWGNPLVDCGREMQQPLRLAGGEMLYADVRHIYGPLSPYVNAALYRIFGPSLGALYADGLVTAILILALVYWLSRQLMGRAASAAATLSVMWLCAFKQAGNYFLPYSYSALHGCALGLLTLALLVRFIQKVGAGYLIAAGTAAGLTALAKTEMGVAALVAGVVAAALTGYPRLRDVMRAGAQFITPAAIIVIAAYGLIAARVGWEVLSGDSFLFMRNLPPELVYFNKRMSGFDEPLLSLAQMLGALVKIGGLVVVIACASLLLARWKNGSAGAGVDVTAAVISDAGLIRSQLLWALIGLGLLALLTIPVAGQIRWDQGPYLAMPALLVGLLVAALLHYRRQMEAGEGINRQTVVLIVVAAYALASLARILLRVRSGGAYSSYLLPASVILFTYLLAYTLPGLFDDRRARVYARKIAIILVMLDVVGTAGLLAYRYRAKNSYEISTARGTMVTLPDLGKAFDDAIRFINHETAPTDYVAVMPEGTSLNFFTGRPNPLREEIVTPGFLDGRGEERAIRQLAERNTQLVLITNRATPEFGARTFGVDYCRRLMGWVEENYEPVAVFGPGQNPDPQIGDKTFFIRAYRRKPLFEANAD
ncbi:MAG TPA: glycosyltransferase family 39 protein [Blastocatellia bacterium]|nr:glycosyltransferase family 39 protein [Blastocatellia bacterium]